MVAEIIDGKKLSHELKMKMKEEVNQLKKTGVTPHLTVILVGDNPASKSYVKGKEKACEETGITSDLIELNETITEDELLAQIVKLNNDNYIHVFIFQLSLLNHIEKHIVIEIISHEKDVDGFHPVNIGRMKTGQDTLLPCPPHGIIKMLKSKN